MSLAIQLMRSTTTEEINLTGMQDFNYLGSNTFEITLEIGCVKYPDAKVLPKEWDNNRPALLNFMWQVRHTWHGFAFPFNMSI